MGAKIDRGAFEGLVREHHAGAYRAALRVVRDEALALDAVQQAFLAVLEGRVALKQAADAGKLLRCVAARQAAMLLRSERARAGREAEVGMQRRERSEAGDPGEIETRGALRACLAELPEELRLAVVLRFQESLTLAEIGAVLEVSEASVHGRLERALEKLRERLSQAGFAAMLPRLPEILAHDEAVSVPPQALPRLLALSQGTLALTTLVPVAAAVLLASAPRAADERAVAGGLEGAPGASARAPVARAVESAAGTLAEGRIEGQVRDELGFAVEGAEVDASSLERDGKSAASSRSTRSGKDGGFELSLPVAVASGQDYALSARTSSLTQDAGVVRVRSGQTAPYQRIRLFAPVTDSPGSWALDLLVRDPEGRAVAGAVARVFRTVSHSNGASWLQWQEGGQTNESGELTLRGEDLGTGLLSVDARAQGFAILRERVELHEPGGARHVAVLHKGLSIRGTILDENGAALDAQRLGAPGSTPLYAFADDPNEWLGAAYPEAGRFEIAALADEPHELRFQSERWSPFSLHAVRPGAEPLQVQLKLRYDPRDVGLHDAEIHARLVDAATGAPLAAHAAWTWIDRIDDNSPGLADGDFAPLLMQQVMVQTGDFSSEEEPAPAPPPEAITCAGLEAGRYALRVRLPGYAPALLGPLELGPREIASGRLVRLARGSLRGVVLDEHGRPLAGATVVALGSGALSRQRVSELDQELRQTAGRGTIHSDGATSDADGRFQLANVPAGLGLPLVALHPEHPPVESGLLELSEGQASADQILRTAARRER